MEKSIAIDVLNIEISAFKEIRKRALDIKSSRIRDELIKPIDSSVKVLESAVKHLKNSWIDSGLKHSIAIGRDGKIHTDINNANYINPDEFKDLKKTSVVKTKDTDGDWNCGYSTCEYYKSCGDHCCGAGVVEMSAIRKSDGNPVCFTNTLPLIKDEGIKASGKKQVNNWESRCLCCKNYKHCTDQHCDDSGVILKPKTKDNDGDPVCFTSIIPFDKTKVNSNVKIDIDDSDQDGIVMSDDDQDGVLMPGDTEVWNCSYTDCVSYDSKRSNNCRLEHGGNLKYNKGKINPICFALGGSDVEEEGSGISENLNTGKLSICPHADCASYDSGLFDNCQLKREGELIYTKGKVDPTCFIPNTSDDDCKIKKLSVLICIHTNCVNYDSEFSDNCKLNCILKCEGELICKKDEDRPMCFIPNVSEEKVTDAFKDIMECKCKEGYSIEPHGPDGNFALYFGRCSHKHGSRVCNLNDFAGEWQGKLRDQIVNGLNKGNEVG